MAHHHHPSGPRRGFVPFLLAALACVVLLSAHAGLVEGGTVHLLQPRQWGGLEPPRAGYLAFFDGEPHQGFSALRHDVHELSQGRHFVQVRRTDLGDPPSAEYSVDLRGATADVLLPGSREQCFVTFALPDGARRGARVVARHAEGRPVSLDGVRYVGVDALPAGGEGKPGARLVEEFPCSALNRSDAALVALLATP